MANLVNLEEMPLDELQAIVTRRLAAVEAAAAERNMWLARKSELEDQAQVIAFELHELNVKLGLELEYTGSRGPKRGYGGAPTKPCTIDDCKTVFESRGALAKALGHGVTGNKSPKFRFLTAEEKKTWLSKK